MVTFLIKFGTDKLQSALIIINYVATRPRPIMLAISA